MRLPRFPKDSFSSRALAYAKSVASGKTPACWQIKAAAQRMIDDFSREDIVWATSRVDHVCEFVECIVHIKGEWAGTTIKLENFQVWLLANIFGWEVRSTSKRRFREAIIMLPRKQAKSTLAAAIGLYMGFADGEKGSEVYCGASNLSQALEVFKPAQQMASKSPGFTDAFDVEVMARSIFSESQNQTFQPVIGKTKDGSSPHCAICDELHQAKDETQLQAFRTGMGARSQPLLLIISTAGVNLGGVLRQEQLDAEAVLKETAADDRRFIAIWTIDPGDDWRDINVWRKANPGWGVTVGEDFFRAALDKALLSPANAAFARTKYLNEWVSSASAWLNTNDWSNARDETITREALQGRAAYLGADLSSRQDLTGIVLAIPLDDGRTAILPFALAPQGAIEGSPNAPAYAAWVESGDLIDCEGAASSFAEIEALIDDLCTEFQIKNCVFDLYQGENTRQKLAARGLQTTAWASNDRVTTTLVMDDFEADLKNGKIVHPGHAVLDWCAANICASIKGVSRMPVKPSRDAKIDVMMAALFAYAASQEEEAPPSGPMLMFV